ncbi:MAG: hypothetical protein WA952_12035 [Lewinella sp.]
MSTIDRGNNTWDIKLVGPNRQRAESGLREGVTDGRYGGVRPPLIQYYFE